MNNSFYKQLDFLMRECRAGAIDIHELMQLIDMAYKDYLDFNPEEIENYYKLKGKAHDERSNSA